jgi:hypothetical protein
MGHFCHQALAAASGRHPPGLRGPAPHEPHCLCGVAPGLQVGGGQGKGCGLQQVPAHMRGPHRGLLGPSHSPKVDPHTLHASLTCIPHVHDLGHMQAAPCTMCDDWPRLCQAYIHAPTLQPHSLPRSLLTSRCFLLPPCRRSPQGEPVLPNGMPWRQHLHLMVVSAKLLADTEALLQMSGGQGGAADKALLRQMMYGPRQLPLPYLMTQLTTFSEPLKFPDHANIMELRKMRHAWVAARPLLACALWPWQAVVPTHACMVPAAESSSCATAQCTCPGTTCVLLKPCSPATTAPHT